MRKTSIPFRPLQGLRPIAAALALTGLAGPLAAQTLSPSPNDLPTPLLREDGTPLQVDLRGWHQAALASYPRPAAPATTRVVTSCADDGPGSLREISANSAPGDTIDLTQLACSAITLETGAIKLLLDSVTIVGPGADRLAIDGNDYDRVFIHYGGGGFQIRDLTVRNGGYRATGFHVGFGGCIASAGYLTLDHSLVTGCYSAGEGSYGGAIYAYSLILSYSTMSDNFAYGTHKGADMASFGGAAFVYQIDLVNSTVTGNVARSRFNPPRRSYDIGGGISTVRGGLVVNSTIDSNYTYGRGGGLATFSDVTITNSTISGNVARTFGGGGLFVRWPAALDVRNSTITANRGHEGGGVLVDYPQSFRSSIVAGNNADIGHIADFSSRRAIAVSGAKNLIDSLSSNATLPDDTLRGDPGLLPLAYNGGPTRTHALRPNSRSIDAGDNPIALASDQRGDGHPRVVGAATDIGAFEFAPGGTDPPPPQVPVPTLSGWATALLASALALLGVRRFRRRAPIRTRM